MFRVAGVYAVVGWILAQASGVFEEALSLPPWFDTLVVSLVLLGFPIAMLLAWAFEMTPEGVKRTESVSEGESVTAKTGRTLDFVIIGGLVLVAALVLGNRLMPQNAGGPTGPSIHAEVGNFAGQSIAVLPFEDFSADKDQAYFADGIAEELLNVLARVEGLRVASRTSAFYYKGREASLAEIGQALNVEHILEGSVRKAGNTLRITAQLIDTKSDEHLWSETYDRPLTAENIFVIQDEISKAIVLELNGRLDLLPETNARPTQSTEAFEAYLKGKEAYIPRSALGIETAITELIRAVTLDPDFAVAHAQLARAYLLARVYAGMPRDYAKPRAAIHINRALELAPKDWDVLSEHAWAMHVIGDYPVDQVIAAFDAAIAANPNNAEAHRGKGYTLFNEGQRDAAIVPLERARVLNPKDALVLLNLFGLRSDQDRNEEARNLVIEAVRLDPTALHQQSTLGNSYNSTGEIEMAHRIWQSCRAHSFCRNGLGILYTILGVEVDDPIMVDKLTQLYQLFLAGKTDEAAQLVPTVMNGIPMAQVSVYNLLGRPEAAYQVIEDNSLALAPWLEGASSNDILTIGNEQAILATLAHANDPRAAAVRRSLASKYDGVVPGSQVRADVYLNGAEWRMLENDPDGAMIWLNALANRGIFTPIEPIAAFKPLKHRPDYQAFLARMESYKARDRTVVEAQLANPPEIWWTPYE